MASHFETEEAISYKDIAKLYVELKHMKDRIHKNNKLLHNMQKGLREI